MGSNFAAKITRISAFPDWMNFLQKITGSEYHVIGSLAESLVTIIFENYLCHNQKDQI